MTVEWRDIPGYEGFYQASSEGQIRSLDRITYGRNRSTRAVKGRVLRPRVNSQTGYIQSCLSLEGRQVYEYNHRLVCSAFYGPQDDESLETLHWDGDKSNNAPRNLRWGTRKENMADKKQHGTSSPRRKLDTQRAEAVRLMARSGLRTSTIAGVFNVSTSNVLMVVSGKTWRADS